MDSSVVTLMAPADSPATVTRAGSPPNAAMLFCTHGSAASWSSSPRLAHAVADEQEALGGQPVVDLTHTMPSRANAEPSYSATDAEPFMNEPPWTQTSTGSPASPGPGPTR